jgi:hypothetical protein
VYFLNETLLKPLEFEAYTMFHALTLNKDGLKYDSCMELLGYFSHFLPQLDIVKPLEEGIVEH